MRRAPDPLIQFTQSRKTALTDIVIGLDFGTSSSKVVVRSPYKLGKRAVAVPFPTLGYERCRYLLPSRVFVGPAGQVGLETGLGWQEERDLKVGMLGAVPTDSLSPTLSGRPGDSLALSAAYLALVLRETREWFLRTQTDAYGSDEIRWSLNLGIPSAGYDDHRVRHEFGAVARAAWALSLEGNALLVDHAKEITEQALAAVRTPFVGAAKDGEVRIGVIPEVTAQVIGYGKSHERAKGLHVLIDVGASTFDISAFIVHVEGEEARYPMLTADTVQLGLRMLQLGRMDSVQSRPPLDKLPDDLIGPIPEWKGMVIDPEMARKLAQYDTDFVDRWVRRLNRTLRDLRKRRDPHSPRWKEGLPVFACGGGSVARLFESFAERADRNFREWAIVEGLRFRRLPAPKGLIASSETSGLEVFSRLGVAYGLSYDAVNIPKTEPPGDIEDILVPAAQRDYRALYVDKDQV